MNKIPKAVSDYLKTIGRKGGGATGSRKVRGSKEFYANLGRLSAAARAKLKADKLKEEKGS